MERGPDMHNVEAPLAGRSVLVTRTREQAQGLAEPLQALGAEVLYFPVIEVVDPEDLDTLDQALSSLRTYDWLVVTSTNGVDRLLDRLRVLDGAAEALSTVKVAVVGSATADHLRARGMEPDLVPVDFHGEGLVEALQAQGVGPGSRVLIARALEAREVIPESLRGMGAEVDVVASYRVVPAAPDPEVARRLAEGTVDIATFASGGTFKHFLEAVAEAGLDPAAVTASLALASVGPITSDAIRSAGFEVAVEAPKSTMGSFAAAIAAHFSNGDGGFLGSEGGQGS